MIKFIKSLPYHMKTAVNSLLRHFALTFSSSTAVMVTLTLLMVFLVVAGNVANFTYSIEDSLKIHATIESTLSDDDILLLQDKIEKLPHVKKVTYSNKDEELESYISGMDESSQKLYKIYEGEGNPLLNAFIIEVDNGDYLETVNKALIEMEEIHDSAYGGDSASMLIKAMDGIRFTGGIFVIALSILAIFLISNTIKSAIYSRNNEIAIMRNVGATNGFIKMPFMIEGMFIGILGSILPIILTIFGYRYIYDSLNGVLLIAMFKLQPVYPFVFYVSLTLLITGMVVGMLGSFFAVNKYLRWKR
ncbi:MAG: permease-like cell division protein FtsX [Traorella sp.]